MDKVVQIYLYVLNILREKEIAYNWYVEECYKPNLTLIPVGCLSDS